MAHLRPRAARVAVRRGNVAGGVGLGAAMSLQRCFFASAAVALASLSTHTAAGAAELTVTAQAVAAHGEFLSQVAAPSTQGVLCLVDSGVNVNPDTEPNLVGRETVLDGTTDDVTSYHHGTYVAM